MRMYRLLAGFTLALALLSLAPERAAAHARPQRAEPPMEGVAAAAPPRLVVWFSEGVRNAGSGLQVVDSAGNQVDLGDAQVDLTDPDRKQMWVSLQPLADGVYTVRWQTHSADDDHDADGTFRFGIGASTVLPPATSSGPLPDVTTDPAG
jgi:copper transport protein